MRISDSRGMRLALAFLLVVSSGGVVPNFAAPAEPQPPSNGSVELALRAYAILDEQAHRPGADPSDISFTAGKLGFDANRIFVFVRDETRLEPYQGTLRGARGVLAGRAGNSLDRALLLQALLTESGIPCRLMQGTLPDAAAQQALQQFLNPPNNPPAPAAADETDPGATKLMQRAGMPDSLIADIHDRSITHSAAFWRSVSSQAEERATYLAGLLTASGLKAPSAEAVQKELLQSLKGHYWVQRQDAARHWIDLDPLLASLQPGQTAGQDGKPLGKVPAAEHHTLDFSLIYRTKADGGSKEEVVLKQTIDAAEAPFKPMAFAVQSADTNLPSPLDLTDQQKVDLVHRMKKFQGIFRAGSQMTAGRPFDLEGNTYDVAPGGVIGNASGVGNAAIGNFGGFGGALGGGGAKEKPANTFIDLRVVMTLRSPGRPAETQTRVLVTAQKSAAPLLNWEVFLQPAFSPTKLMEYQFTDYLARQRPYVEAMFAPKQGSVPMPNSWPFPIYAASISMLRNASMRRTLGTETGVVPLMDRPNLFMTTHAVRLNAAGTGMEGRWGVDLVEMGLNWVPKAAANESAALNLALHQSVAESTIEQMFLANSFPANGVTSSSARFDMARASGAAVQVVHPSDAAALKTLNWTDADAKDIGSAEPANQLIVATAATPGEPASWWTVSPNGTAVARSTGGFGEAETDYMELTLNVACKILCFIEMVNAKKGSHAFASFLLCAAMQAGGGAAEMIAEDAEYEGMGFIVATIDLTIWAVMGMTEPKE